MTNLRPLRLPSIAVLLIVAASLVAIGCTTDPASPAPGSSGAAIEIGIRGQALAGPTCPVERPGDSACAPRPVAGAVIHVLAADGHEVATATTDAAGRFLMAVPAGDYRVVGDASAGTMRPPAAASVTVGSAITTVQLDYDTGIR
jgi:hypothetical protein